MASIPSADRQLSSAQAQHRAEVLHHAQHEAAHHIAAVTPRTNWPRVLAALGAVIVIVIGGGWALNVSASKAIVSKAVDAADAEVVGTMPTQKATSSLVDGTKIAIGADSRVKIPKIFNEEARAVRAEGLIRFQVAQGKLPFQVYVGRAIVTAKGTTFTTRWFPEDSVAYVALQDGSVDVKVGEVTRTLGPGTGLVIPKEGAVRDATAAELLEVTTWVNDTLTVQNRPLKQALTEVRRWYGDAIVADTALWARPVSFVAPVNKIRDAIGGIEVSGKVKFGYVGSAMVFQDPAKLPK